MKLLRGGISFRILLVVSVSLILTAGCQQKSTNNFKGEIDSIGIVWVPDLREGIYEAELISRGLDMILKGETNIPEAKDAITGLLNQKGVIFKDSLKVLPDVSEIN